MYIKSVVIDGFKSYGQRTEVSGFDPAFNAITGLNGSGKSNILDSICFLLGITNLSHVRANNLQELVYKNGQAGITKATVSITFDNTDKKQSPVSYEDYDEFTLTRQVVIGGKNKYLLNGSNIQNNRVQDLFRSVQLNVNNPHFLIMQGRITKVLNMKPPEILAMLEEAAGTMMYESKKQQAQKTIEKKDSKLREINDLLNEEITPTLAKLKKERSTYLEFQKIQRELEHLQKIYISYTFLRAEETASTSQESLDNMKKELNTFKNEVTSGKEKIISIKEHIENLQRHRDEELGGKLSELEQDLTQKEKDVVKIETSYKSTKDNIKQEEKKRNQIIKGMNSDKKHHEIKVKQAEGMKDAYAKLRENNAKCVSDLEEAQKRFEAISLGKFRSEDGKAETLQGQVIKLKSDISQAQTKLKTHDMTIKHNNKEIKKLEQELKKTENEHKKDSANLRTFEKQVESAEKELKSIKYEEGSMERVEEQYRNIKHEVQALSRNVEEMKSRFQWLDFRYSDPEPNFDRSQVKGVVANLFEVKDPKFNVALDSVAGGKLTNIIVKTANTASKILKKGRLARRTNFLPIDKMNARPITSNDLHNAQKLVGKDNVFRAIDLVSFDRELTPAMEFVFGSVFICTNIDVANKIAFDKSVGKMCVTIKGDKVNPSGELSGGAAPSGGSMLAQITAIKQHSQNLEEKRSLLNSLHEELRKLGPISKRYNDLLHQHEIKTKELETVRERLSHTDHHKLSEEIKNLKQQCESLSQEIEESKQIEAEGVKKVKDLEYKIKNAKQLKEKELKDAEAEVKKCKKAVEASKKVWSEKEAEEDTLKLDIQGLEKAIQEAEQQIEGCKEAIEGYKKELEELTKQLEDGKALVAEAKDAVKHQKEEVARNNKEINNQQAQIEKISKSISEKELQIQEFGHKLSKAELEAKDAEKLVENMLDKYEWISIDRKYFGVKGSAYDYEATNPKEAKKKISDLETMKDKLERTVNMKAMTMLDKAEVQYNDLMRKKTTVETDKLKIKKVIEELDRKKKLELRTAWDKVNKDFGSIFSSLLPGTKAKLQPPEGKDVLDGLEVKVAFGDVWKESLSELSGGQRSLVALSLILSLLLFKPAPLYILDEVDAALDLSHTQNIGHMLKTHFKHSQFIVVSLKDGMFNNANVLFRTKFVDGMSTVTRLAQRESKK